MGEAKRRRQMAGLASAMDLELGEKVLRQAYQNTCQAFDLYPNDMVDALIASYRGRNASLDLVAKNNPEDSVACRAGCSACCHQMVLCSPFEIFILAQLLLSTRSNVDLEGIEHRLSEISRLPLNPHARYGRHATCPLLVNDRCSVYDRRPAVCRALYSNSKASCEQALASGGGDVGFLVHPQMLSSAMQVGIDSALRQKRGLNVEPVEMCGSLLIALQDFNSSLTDWLNGGDPFADFQVRRTGSPTNAQQVEHVAARLGL
ncbi:YkgJ family cysteine cluster protein [Mesorhizobium sp. YC-39]|uniref:YkgJ family cysteine cluster protein n=1 Tax=unclassified Mesorhizobium TaxID=325217 RepID=UPI0021E73D98|nr:MULTISPECIES: YkgJ family cysteine cluster protein [unclassified Mesorhizobium]MCV3211465.1 YkgJ family cysteine cluster protein [Mesorhizobium sp. YC-2]MCV3233179.1 YkgJ family cysteine cluster protein [Mesorhizobium sp. YC-39]